MEKTCLVQSVANIVRAGMIANQIRIIKCELVLDFAIIKLTTGASSWATMLKVRVSPVFLILTTISTLDEIDVVRQRLPQRQALQLLALPLPARLYLLHRLKPFGAVVMGLSLVECVDVINTTRVSIASIIMSAEIRIVELDTVPEKALACVSTTLITVMIERSASQYH